MFNDAIKKIAAAGLVFSLCAPCSFASAQNGSRNITTRWSYLSAMQQAAQPAQLQPSALERLWTECGGRDVLTVQGRRLGTSQEFASEVRRIGTPLPIVSRGILQHLIKGANLSVKDALAFTQEVMAEIYNLDKIEAGCYAMQALADLKAHPTLSKFLFK